jgi:cytochrome c oxidase assembly factor CtaG
MAPLAAAYSGPPKLTVVRAFTQWRLDLPMLVLILLLAAWYLFSVRRVTRTGGQWGTGRTIAFFAGLCFWAIATMAWPGAYQDAVFYARATQTVVLVLLTPLFLSMGKPLTLFLGAYPGPGPSVERVVHSRVVKVLMFPAFTTLALIAVPFSMYFTGWYTAFFDSGAIRELTYLILIVPGYAFFWTLLRVDPVPKEYPYMLGMWIAAAEVVGDAFFGIAVLADQTMIGGAHYLAVGYPFGPSLATAQVLGGGILWILGDAVGLPFLAVQLIQMMRADKREADEIDAELDARDAARAAARAAAAFGAASPLRPAAASASPGSAAASASLEPGAESAGAAVADEAGEDDRPWWENDPRITDRFRRA